MIKDFSDTPLRSRGQQVARVVLGSRWDGGVTPL